jgi:hypothetical protein
MQTILPKFTDYPQHLHALAGIHQQLLEFCLTKDIRRGSLAIASEHVGGRQFVSRVFGMHEASKPPHRLESIRSLGFRWSQGGPRDGGARDDMGLATRVRKACELAEIAFNRGQGKAGGTAHSQIRVNSMHQHDITSGHGLATMWSRSISTLA